jgi:haloacetate dehalogenase
MAKVVVEAMEALGHVHFRLAGHDRGGRVAYRLALDHAGRVDRLATLDIVPTYDMWMAMDRNMAMKVWHWPYLAQPAPLPEMLIDKAPVALLEWKMASWTKAKNLSAFDPRLDGSLRRVVLRSVTHPCAVRGLPGWPGCRFPQRRSGR